MSQTKYLCIQRSQPQSGEKPSPAQMEQMYAAFNAWKEKFKDNIVDMGGGLKAGGTVVTADSDRDGPFVESKELIGGFMIIQADSIELAKQVCKESPGVMGPGSSVEIREISTP
ncbi:MAG: YciI family protein [Fibrobacterales bacterium]